MAQRDTVHAVNLMAQKINKIRASEMDLNLVPAHKTFVFSHEIQPCARTRPLSLIPYISISGAEHQSEQPAGIVRQFEQVYVTSMCLVPQLRQTLYDVAIHKFIIHKYVSILCCIIFVNKFKENGIELGLMQLSEDFLIKPRNLTWTSTKNTTSTFCFFILGKTI